MALSTIIRWLVTIRFGKNFLHGDLVNNTIIKSNLRVPGLLKTLILAPECDSFLLAPFVELVALTILAARYFYLSFSLRYDCPFFAKLSGWTDNKGISEVKLSFF